MYDLSFKFSLLVSTYILLYASKIIKYLQVTILMERDRNYRADDIDISKY